MRPVKPRPRAKNTSPRNALSRFSKFFFIASRSALPSSSFSFPSTKAPRQSSFSLVVVLICNVVLLAGVKKKKVQTNLFCRSILLLILYLFALSLQNQKKEKREKREERHHHHLHLPKNCLCNLSSFFFRFVIRRPSTTIHFIRRDKKRKARRTTT